MQGSSAADFGSEETFMVNGTHTFEETPAVPAKELDMAERLAQLEAFHTHVSGAIDSLVDTILHVRNHDVAGLQTRVRELEQQLHLERCNRDLAEVSRMHPKERIVVFVGTTYFGDNVKYAWLAARERAQALKFDCWFLPFNAEQEETVRRLGGHCFPSSHNDWSADQLHAALAAAVVVTSDHLLGANPYAAALLAGARQVQMWHGVSIKEIGFRNLTGLKNMSPQFARVLKTAGKFASFTGTASHNESEWRRWFAFDHYAATGYPRNDVLHREPTANDLLNVDMAAYERACEAQRQGRRVVLYAPTFRDANRGQWILRAGLERIARAVADAGDCLMVNMHPVEQPHVPDIAQTLPGVCFVAPRTDVYPLLAKASLLVTDYSSIMFDFLHLDRPIVLFRPDHQDYITRSRRLFDDKLATPPGPVALTAVALVEMLRRPQSPEDIATRRRLATHLHDHRDGASASRVLELITDELQRARV
jgi:CDP-glycerol glycerophosphotransferase